MRAAVSTVGVRGCNRYGHGVRRLFLILSLFLAACPGQPSVPYEKCDDYEPCLGGDFECIGFRCIPGCLHAGDCDPGYRCESGQCIESCESQDDCTIGTCGELGEGRRGAACMLTNLPQCGDDSHCFGNICVDGACQRWCDSAAYCGVGQICDLVRGDYGYCAPDPDYEPPPPPQNCAEAPAPDVWCAERNDNTFRCDRPAAICRQTYAAILVRDETPDCEVAPEAMAPGADILGLRAFEEDGSQAVVYLSVYTPGTGDGNDHVAFEEIETVQEPVCSEQRWLSLGCGGWLLVVADGVTPLMAGWTLQVNEDRGLCEGAADFEEAGVYLCPRFPSVQTPEEDCGVRLGSTAAQDTWIAP